MTTTSGILGALALIIITTLAFPYGSQREHAKKKHEPTKHVYFDVTERS